MCDKTVEAGPSSLARVSDSFKTEEMCIKAVEAGSWLLYHVPDQFKTQEMCDKAVKKDPFSLQYVPDWFVILQQLKLWDDDDDDGLIKWHDGYRKRKAKMHK